MKNIKSYILMGAGALLLALGAFFPNNDPVLGRITNPQAVGVAPAVADLNMAGYDVNNAGGVDIDGWELATSTVVCMAPEVCEFQADGTADDVQIQAAIDYMDAIGGGTVHIKHGTYDITAPIDINADTGTYILGDGWEATILAANASMTTTDYVIDFTPSASGIYAKIQDLKINAGCHASGIDMEGAVESEVRDVHINNPYNWGIYINQGSGPFGHHNEVVGVLTDGGDSCSGIGQAIKIEGSDENYIAHSEFQYMGGSNASGTDATILDKAGLNTIQSNYFVHLAQRGIQIQDAYKDVISGNTFDGVSGDNVYLNGASTVLSNNQFHSIGSTSAQVAVMLNFYDNNSVTGNVFNSHETDNYLASFIKTQAGSDNHTISNNVFIENGALTGPYLDISGSNNVLGNSNYTTNTIIGDLHIGNSTASGTQLYFYHTDGTQIGLDTYSFGWGEYGLSTPQLKLTDGRFDFDPTGDKAEFRVSGANTQFNIYNTNLGQYYMQMSADGSNVTSVVFPRGNVGIGTSTPVTKLDVYNATATSSAYIYSGGAGLGGRLILEDIDAAGCTEITALNGVLTAQTVTCP